MQFSTLTGIYLMLMIQLQFIPTHNASFGCAVETRIRLFQNLQTWRPAILGYIYTTPDSFP